MKKFTVLLFIALPFWTCQKQTSEVLKEIPHVLVIGIDGLGAHGLELANNIPNFTYLMENGAYSLKVTTVLPSVSAPTWSTILTGTTPERHSVGGNDWRLETRKIDPVTTNEYNYFPTLFGEIRAKYPNAILGAVYHWGTIGDLIEKDACDLSTHGDGEINTTLQACKFIEEKKPNFTFVHLDHQDGAGHSKGYRSEEYVASVERTDSIVGLYIDALKKADLFEKTTIFIVSDHGGVNTGHGGYHADEMTVPLIIYGKGIKQGYQVEPPVFTYDIAPTIEKIFSITPNEWVVGRSLDIFSE
ncbi:MAG: alkaline phosphatase family protein [Fermentimonas sp.]|jgi:predicted AlkP superfamily pyrophosphatase or phosphodiesterase